MLQRFGENATAAATTRGACVTYHVWADEHTPSYWRTHMAAYLHFYASALGHCSS
jgi:hypothetical protein